MESSNKSIEYVLDALCNYYYIYGENRSRFMSGWVSEIRTAVYVDSVNFDKADTPIHMFDGLHDKEISGTYFFMRQALNEMCRDIEEMGEFPITDEKYLTDQCCKYFEAAWKFKERENFKRKLAGQRVIHDW